MIFKRKRYQARRIRMTVLKVRCGGLWDNETGTWARSEASQLAGYDGCCTTYSNAKRIARRANRVLDVRRPDQ